MPRRTVLVGALLATLAASAWVGALPDDPLPPLVEALPAVPDSTALAPASAAVAARRPWRAPPRAALQAWSAPPAPPVPAPPAPASAPPPRFPYAWIGRLDDGGDVQALLANAERSFGARVGDVLDGRWRIERLAGTRMQLSWLPTGETVTVELR